MKGHEGKNLASFKNKGLLYGSCVKRSHRWHGQLSFLSRVAAGKAQTPIEQPEDTQGVDKIDQTVPDERNDASGQTDEQNPPAEQPHRRLRPRNTARR